MSDATDSKTGLEPHAGVAWMVKGHFCATEYRVTRRGRIIREHDTRIQGCCDYTDRLSHAACCTVADALARQLAECAEDDVQCEPTDALREIVTRWQLSNDWLRIKTGEPLR